MNGNKMASRDIYQACIIKNVYSNGIGENVISKA